MKNLLLPFVLCLLSAGTIAQNFDDIQIKTNQVTEHIYFLEGRGGNIGVLVGEEGVLMVDDQYAPLSEKIKAAVQVLSTHPLKYLINTHWHGDHAGGNENFGNEGAIIVAHENVRERLSTDQVNKAFNRTTPASPEAAWPEITFSEDIQLHFNGQDIVLLHVHNAHTDGDSFVWFPNSNVLHMGDCFFKGRFPYIDLGSGGSVAGAIKAVQIALSLTDSATKIIPGHGQLANKQDLLNYHNMLIEIVDRVKLAMAEGKTLDEMKAAGLDAGYEAWGTGFINAERFVDIIWTDLNRE